MSKSNQKASQRRPSEFESLPTASPEQQARDRAAHSRARMASWSSGQFPSGRHPDAGEKVSGQLGEPTARRRKKSTEGFHIENLAGDISVAASKNSNTPKVSRAVERTPFTLPAQRARALEDEVERAIRLGRAPDVMAKLTAVDRMLEDHEFQALAWYVQNHVRRQSGRPARMRYDDTPRGLIESDDEDSETRRILNSAAMEYVDARLPEAGKEFLATLAHMTFPSLHEARPPTKIEVGRAIGKIEGRDRSEGIFEGYTRCISQALADLRGDWAIEYKRQEDAKLLRKAEGRKKQASKLFDELTK